MQRSQNLHPHLRRIQSRTIRHGHPHTLNRLPMVRILLRSLRHRKPRRRKGHPRNLPRRQIFRNRLSIDPGRNLRRTLRGRRHPRPKHLKRHRRSTPHRNIRSIQHPQARIQHRRLHTPQIRRRIHPLHSRLIKKLPPLPPVHGDGHHSTHCSIVHLTSATILCRSALASVHDAHPRQISFHVTSQLPQRHPMSQRQRHN